MFEGYEISSNISIQLEKVRKRTETSFFAIEVQSGKTDKKNNEAKGQGPRKYLHRRLLGSGDFLRAVVCNCVGRAECEGTLKLFTHPRRVETVIDGAPHRAAAEWAPRRHLFQKY